MSNDTVTSTASDARRWVVMKFGGTSVSFPHTWHVILKRIQGVLAANKKAWVTISALTQVTNKLQKSVSEAIAVDDYDRSGNEEGRHRIPSFEEIKQSHFRLAEQLGLDRKDIEPLNKMFSEIERQLEGISLLKEASPRIKARVMSYGELLSTTVGIAFLNKHISDAIRLDARNFLVSTPRPNEQEADKYLEALVEPVNGDSANGDKLASGHRVVLTQGFISRTPRGETCLLGRGGSDTSASLFGALIAAEVVEIWTDVHGMFTTDPNQCSSARLIKKLSFREAQELAAMGAKVLHPRCIGPAQQASIPILIKNTFDPDVPGTLITTGESAAADDTATVIAVAKRTNVTLISLSTLEMWGASGFLAKAFMPFEALGISIDLVGTSQSAVSVTLDYIPDGVGGEAFQKLLERLKQLGKVEVIHPCAVVSVVGRKIREVLHVLGPALSVFKEHEIHLISESSENINLSFVLAQESVNKLVQDLHNKLIPPEGVKDEIFGLTWENIKKQQAHRQ